MTDKDLALELGNDELLKQEFEKVKDVEQCDIENDDQDELRLALFNELESSELDAWHDIFDRELNRFAKDEEYDYITDMRRTYAQGLATPEAMAMFRTIPDYVFWDIKKPLKNNDLDVPRNPYNPARAAPTVNFFDARTHEQWLEDRRNNMKMKESVSKYRMY